MKTSKILRYNPNFKIPEVAQEFRSMEELFSLNWIVEWKEELEKISNKDYHFYKSNEGYRDEYSIALLLASNNHHTIIGWCNSDNLIKTLPDFRHKEI